MRTRQRGGIIRVGHSESLTLKTINTMYNLYLLTFYLTAWDTSYRAQPHATLTCNIRSPIFPHLSDCLWVCKYVSSLHSCLSVSWVSITRRTSHESPHRITRYCFKHARMHMPRWSTDDMGHPLELPRHYICMFMGFRPSQYPCFQWILVENLPPSFGTHVLGCCRSGDDNHLGISTVVGRSSIRKTLQRWTIKV